MFGIIFGLLFFIIKLILLIGFLFSFLTHFMLWIEKRLKQLKDEPEHLKMPWKNLFYNFLIEGLGNTYGMLSLPFSGIPDNQEVALPKHSMLPPILLLHGFVRNQLDFIWMKQQLQAIDGMGPIYTINLVPHKKNIERHAKIVANKIEEIKEKTGSNQVILIGHSRGGLVASYYAEYLAEKESIAKIITLGTPFNGTTTTVFGYGLPVKELTPHAENLAKLNELITNSSINYYHIASKLDNVILPWHSACPFKHQNKDNVLILEDHSHVQLLISPKVIHRIAAWLLQEPSDF